MNHPPTYVRTFSLHKVRENCHFLDHPPTPMSLRNIKMAPNAQFDLSYTNQYSFFFSLGCRFWSFEHVNKLWNEVLIPCFKLILSNVSSETLPDWEICLSGATNRQDSNRLKWLFDLLIDQRTLSSSTMEGAFSQASYLRLLNKSIVQNWKLKELFKQSFELLKHQFSHPYNKVSFLFR